MMSLADVDRLAAALLTLLQASDTTHSSNVLATSRRSFSDGRKTCQRLPLSATTSSPSSTSTPRPSNVYAVDNILRPASLVGSGGRATPVSARYKTELCRAFTEHGACRYGDKCQFAHGRDDLRTVARHPKYKTDLCRTYHSTGLCPYGPRCHFIHDEHDDGRPLKPPAADKRCASLAREMELRLALRSLHQCQTAASTSSNFHLRPKSEHRAAATVAPAVVPRWHLPLDRRHSVSEATEFWSLPTFVASSPSASVGGDSASSSAVDDDSPPPRSPTVGAADDACRQFLDQAASNDRLTALLVLAARHRLYANTATQ